MPPKARITKEMILNAAFEIVRRDGIENVNARTISKILGCSTQPVLYYFATIEEIKKETYKKADEYHTNYIMDIQGHYESPMMEIGISYVRFAAKEQNLFKFLFQSDHFSQQSIDELISNEVLHPVLEVLAKTLQTDAAQAKEYFVARFLMVHGMASMLANNSMAYDESYILSLIRKTFYGK